MNVRPTPLLCVLTLLTGLAAEGQAQTTLRHADGTAIVHERMIDGRVVTRYPPARVLAPRTATIIQPEARGEAAPLCGAAAISWGGRALPNGESGTLDGWSFARPATLTNQGRVAFISRVEGAPRNQGVFTADASGLQVVALGCGMGGGSGDTAGCGDPSPVSGTFTGFFVDGWAAPVINDAGDVLFFADVHGGTSPRGLFLYRAASDEIVKVAVINDTSPLGGTFSAIGPGDLSNDGTVVFLAQTSPSPDAAVMVWKNGSINKLVAVGDPVPGGGTVSALSTESLGYQDGTFIPGGPGPSINDQGQVAFRAFVNDNTGVGLFISHNGVTVAQVRSGDAAPGGATYADFGAPLLNNAGQIAFYSDLTDFPGAAWVVGSPGHWRRALAFHDLVGGGKIWGLTLSRNPMNSLNDAGDLVLWASRLMPDKNELQTILLNRADGTSTLIAGQGESTPLGGTWGSMEWFPLINNANQIRVGAGTPGLPGMSDAQILLQLCTSGTPSYASLPAAGTQVPFGVVPVGVRSPPAGIDVGNPGGSGPAPDSDLHIVSASADHAAFTVELLNVGPFAAGSVADGQPDVEVRCTPTAAGPVTATLRVATNDPAQPDGGFSYPLTCEGIDDVLFRDGFEDSL